jgi:hypothetical protein
MSDQLKPCPRCGGECETGRSSVSYFPLCSKCGLEGPPFPTKQEAIDWWNQQDAIEAAVQRGRRSMLPEVAAQISEQCG